MPGARGRRTGTRTLTAGRLRAVAAGLTALATAAVAVLAASATAHAAREARAAARTDAATHAQGTVRARIPPQILAKQAEAQRVLAEVQALDMQLEKAAEAYNLATIRLAAMARSLAANTRDLTVARANLRTAQTTLQQRLRALYTADDEHGDLAVILGATSLDEALARLDGQAAVTAQDTRVIAQVRRFRAAVDARQRELLRDRHEQTALVRERAAKRDVIRQELGQRRALLSTIKDEIVRLQAAERARQERLRREALARLAAQREAAREAAIRRAHQAAALLAAKRAAARRQAEAAAAARARGASLPAARPALAKDEEAALEAQATVVSLPGERAAAPALAPVEVTAAQAAGSGPSGSPFEARISLAPADNPAPAPAAPPARYGDAASVALRYLGIPYVWAGADTSGFDCSGFTMYVFAQLGVSLPHNAAAQYGYGSPVSRGDLAPGDLVFFEGLGHVGIYIGGGQFVHAPHTGDVVKISSLDEAWYASQWVGARRL